MLSLPENRIGIGLDLLVVFLLVRLYKLISSRSSKILPCAGSTASRFEEETWLQPRGHHFVWLFSAPLAADWSRSDHHHANRTSHTRKVWDFNGAPCSRVGQKGSIGADTALQSCAASRSEEFRLSECRQKTAADTESRWEGAGLPCFCESLHALRAARLGAFGENSEENSVLAVSDVPRARNLRWEQPESPGISL